MSTATPSRHIRATGPGESSRPLAGRLAGPVLTGAAEGSTRERVR